VSRCTQEKLVVLGKRFTSYRTITKIPAAGKRAPAGRDLRENRRGIGQNCGSSSGAGPPRLMPVLVPRVGVHLT